MPNFISTTKSRNPFAMFAPNPAKVTFDTQEEGEKIILLLRAHVIILVPAVFIVIFLVLMPIFVSWALNLINVNIADFLNGQQMFLITIFWYLLTFGYAFYRFLFWYFNVYILTNERVVDFDFRGILHKNTSYAALTKIQDVSPRIIGFFGTFFHYGDVFFQTAGTEKEFEFFKVPRPDEVAEAIMTEVRKEEAEPPGVII